MEANPENTTAPAEPTKPAPPPSASEPQPRAHRPGEAFPFSPFTLRPGSAYQPLTEKKES